jgi:hypothetical protein
MKIAPKLVVALMLALLALPNVSTAAYADDNDDDFCQIEENQDEDECRREKPRLQTRFFSE